MLGIIWFTHFFAPSRTVDFHICPTPPRPADFYPYPAEKKAAPHIPDFGSWWSRWWWRRSGAAATTAYNGKVRWGPGAMGKGRFAKCHRHRNPRFITFTCFMIYLWYLSLAPSLWFWYPCHGNQCNLCSVLMAATSSRVLGCSRFSSKKKKSFWKKVSLWLRWQYGWQCAEIWWQWWKYDDNVYFKTKFPFRCHIIIYNIMYNI